MNPRPGNVPELVIATKAMVERKGELFTNDLTQIHPDYRIFEKHFEDAYKPEIEKAVAEVKEKYHNATGPQNNTPTPATNTNQFSDILAKIRGDRAVDVALGFGIALAGTALVVSLVTAMKK